MLDNLTQRLARVMKTLRGEARLTEDNIARIRELFPGCVTEARGEDGGVRLAMRRVARSSAGSSPPPAAGASGV